MTAMSWCFRSSLPGVARGTALAVGGVLILYAATFVTASPDGRWGPTVNAAMQAGLLAGFAAALLLRRRVGGWRYVVPRAVADWLAVAGAIALAAALAATLGTLLGASISGASLNQASSTFLPQPVSYPPGAIGDTLEYGIDHGALAALATAVGYGFARLLAAVATWWNRLRRSHLKWALTHALLIAGWIVGFLFALVGIYFALRDGYEHGAAFGAQTGTGFARTLSAIVQPGLWAVIVLLLIGFLVAVVVAPLVAAISFPVVGSAVRRLGALAAATDALQAGRLETRVVVAGKDEIAQLQTDFNAMAADLERSVAELRAEHAAVQALLDSRRELFAAISHDLRTPLATIRGYLDSTLANPDLARESPALRQDLTVISQETDRLGHLINDLFILARVDLNQLPLNLAPTDIAALLSRIVEASQPLAWRRGRVDVVLDAVDPELPRALADPERVEQIVRNLLTNAVRHTPPGGLVLVAASEAAGMLVIQVRDTGEGIAADDLPHIWDRFYRAGNATDRGGAGLGLSLVKELTLAMGGTVDVTSTVGEGSEFTVRLPLAPSASPARRPAGAAIAAA